MGWSRNDEDFRADHYRDERKHEPRPGDRGFSAPSGEVPVRLAPDISEAMQVAILVKGEPNFAKAANLIEQYAKTIAAEASLQATIDTSDRILAQINGEVA